jgi:hypothetical protein
MWQAIQYVGSGLSLIAFIVAAGTYAYLAKLRQRARIISSASEKEKIAAINATADRFQLDLSGLNNKEKKRSLLQRSKLVKNGMLLLQGGR